MVLAEIERLIKELKEKIYWGTKHQEEAWDRGGVGVAIRLLRTGTLLEQKRKTLMLLKKLKQVQEQHPHLGKWLIILRVRIQYRLLRFHPELLTQEKGGL